MTILGKQEVDNLVQLLGLALSTASLFIASLGRIIRTSSRAVFILVLILSVAGCKVRITVPEGGKVNYQETTEFCLGGLECVIEVNDLFFDETFIAVPDEGYVFLGWKSKAGSFCGRTDEPCRLVTEGFPLLEAILASDQEFYLEPIFEKRQVVDSVDCENVSATASINLSKVRAEVARFPPDCFYVNTPDTAQDFGDLVFFTKNSPTFVTEGPISSPVSIGDLLIVFEFPDALDLGTPPELTASNALVLYFDTDRKTSTGRYVGGIGAEYRTSFHFGCPGFEGSSSNLPGHMEIWEMSGKNSTTPDWSVRSYSDGFLEYYYAVVLYMTETYGAAILTGTSPTALGISEPPLAVLRVETIDRNNWCRPTGQILGTSPIFKMNNYQ